MTFVEYEPYLWKETDKFITRWLPRNGYQIIKTEQFSDYIPYRAQRRKVEYTIFVFAFGKARRFSNFDAEICLPLRDAPFAAGSIVLVLYLHVEETRAEARLCSFLVI